MTPGKNLGRVQHHAVIAKREKSQELVQIRAVIAKLDRRLHHHLQHALTVVSTHMRRQGRGVALNVRPTLVHLLKAGLLQIVSAMQATLGKMGAHAQLV